MAVTRLCVHHCEIDARYLSPRAIGAHREAIEWTWPRTYAFSCLYKRARMCNGCSRQTFGDATRHVCVCVQTHAGRTCSCCRDHILRYIRHSTFILWYSAYVCLPVRSYGGSKLVSRACMHYCVARHMMSTQNSIMAVELPDADRHPLHLGAGRLCSPSRALRGQQFLWYIGAQLFAWFVALYCLVARR